MMQRQGRRVGCRGLEHGVGGGREEGKLRSSDDSAAIFVQLALPYVLGGKIPVREGTLVSQAYLQHQHRRGDWAKQGMLIQDGHERPDDKPIRDQARERVSPYAQSSRDAYWGIPKNRGRSALARRHAPQEERDDKTDL